MRNPIAQDRFDCGWNDIAHGINHWTVSELYSSPMAWVIRMRGIAESCKLSAAPHNLSHYNGVIAACDHYQENGEISPRTRRSVVEINELSAV